MTHTQMQEDLPDFDLLHGMVRVVAQLDDGELAIMARAQVAQWGNYSPYFVKAVLLECADRLAAR